MRSAVRSSFFPLVQDVGRIHGELETLRDRSVFISLKKREAALAEAECLEGGDLEGKPLYGMLFAVKDNIDVAGMPTTAGCAAFSYTPERSATVVERLEAAGAILVGKTNMDQFATGLVGVRSPFGIPQNALRADLIPGGSSSGSAVAVARGFVDFALGTDTAGAGRIPAAMNGIVGLKPSFGLLPTTGVVTACRSLETVAVFAREVDLAFKVMQVCAGFDPEDAYSRRMPELSLGAVPPRPKVGVPYPDHRQFFGDNAAQAAYEADLERLADLGAEIVELDFMTFVEAGRLLYEGPWLAERYLRFRTLIEERPSAILPVTLGIISEARQLGAVEAFDSFYRLAELKRRVEELMAGLDCLAVPTVPRFYTMSDLAREPVRYNSHMGTYSSFVNLLDLAAVSVPVGRRNDGLPSSLCLIGPSGSDGLLAAMGRMATAGMRSAAPLRATGDRVELAVFGSHLSGLSANGELKAVGASFLRATRTLPDYRLFALSSPLPVRPGLLRVGRGEGVAVEAEVWSLERSAFGSLAAGLAAPLSLGTISLADGTEAKGFLIEAAAADADGAEDISAHGGWRAWLSARR
ncbi:allophanate hydrolase [Rhizobium sp. CSW-27]|uniref:allophanate hydrolase n=1 Tax=Rhizobium sp. CSW-27 TaxID=2839985 RepID=UPI001C02E528|nr:allophanate hydrolase [Rhizobium sp. CSW-27]MBT9369806.1 allophanate hydrolase [Rhizobium sp. CSW-27]